MGTRQERIVAGLALVVAAVLVAQCSRRAAEPAPDSGLTPILTVKELMEHMVDPTADWIFDAAVVDISEKGVVRTTPLTDDDWLKVERGAMELAEFTNLLKMPRAVAPPGDEGTAPPPGGGPAPELAPDQIQKKIDANRALWNKHADDLRVVALEALAIIRQRDTDKLFTIGGDIDEACENCHLEYWYPGDKKLVLEDKKKTAHYGKPAAPGAAAPPATTTAPAR